MPTSPAEGSASRSANRPRRSYFSSRKTLLPLNLGQLASQATANSFANVTQTPSEPKDSNPPPEARQLDEQGVEIPGADSTRSSRLHGWAGTETRVQYAHGAVADSSQGHGRGQQTARMRKRLKSEIVAYISERYLSDVYDDFLLGNRRRLYEPSWPPTAGPPAADSPLHQPKSRTEASAILQQTIAPLLDWYSLPDSLAHTPEAVQRQTTIAKALDKHERERGSRECRQKIQSSSADTLYRNVPDAALEANVLMLINRAHLALQRGCTDLAERLVDRSLGMVDGLGYRPLNAKCWYWKGLAADKRGSAREAAEAFFNALECVGKYVEGEYLPKHIQAYENEILGLLGIEDRAGRIAMARKLERAAKGIEPLHLPSPTPARHEGTGLDLTPPRAVPASPNAASRTDQPVADVGRPSAPVSKETGRPELRGLNINIPLLNPRDLSPIRRRSTAYSPASPNPTSPLKPLPAPRAYLPPPRTASLYDALSPTYKNAVDMNTFQDDIDNDPERTASTAQCVIQYTTQSTIGARAERDQYHSQGVSIRPPAAMTDMQAFVLARKLSKKRPSSLSGLPQSGNAHLKEFAETFHPAIQQILLSPVEEINFCFPDFGAELSQPPPSRNSPARSRTVSSYELRTRARATSSPGSAGSSRPASRKPIKLQSRPDSNVLGVVGDIEWQELVEKQTVERASKIQAKKEKYPRFSMKAVRSSVQSLELNELRKKFGDGIPDPHFEHWERVRSTTPSPKEREYGATRDSGNDRMSRLYDQMDSAKRRRMAWRKKAEEEARQSGRGVLWDPDDIWSRDEETLKKEGWFDRPVLRTEEGDREKRREGELTFARLPPPGVLEALYQTRLPGNEEGERKRQTLFLSLRETRHAMKQRRVTIGGPSPGQLQQGFSAGTGTLFPSRTGSVDGRSPAPLSPSPLRRSSLPGQASEDDEEENENERVQSRWNEFSIPAGRAYEEQAPSAVAHRSTTREALSSRPQNPVLPLEDPPDATQDRETTCFTGSAAAIPLVDESATEKVQTRLKGRGDFFNQAASGGLSYD